MRAKKTLESRIRDAFPGVPSYAPVRITLRRWLWCPLIGRPTLLGPTLVGGDAIGACAHAAASALVIAGSALAGLAVSCAAHEKAGNGQKYDQSFHFFFLSV